MLQDIECIPRSDVEAAAYSRTLSEWLPRRSFSEGWVSRKALRAKIAMIFRRCKLQYVRESALFDRVA